MYNVVGLGMCYNWIQGHTYIQCIKAHSCISCSCCSVCTPAMVLLKERMFSEVLKDVKLQGHKLCVVDHKLWTITRSA
jgi:hypothetical protein